MKEITATVSANTRSDHFGALPRWIGSISVCGLKNSTSPITTISSCSTQIAGHQQPDPPRATAAEAADVAEHDERDERQREQQRLGVVPSGCQKTRRYWVAE